MVAQGPRPGHMGLKLVTVQVAHGTNLLDIC